MKYIFLSVFMGFLQVQAFESGEYKCVEGNRYGICDQKISFMTDSQGVSRLTVSYAKDCRQESTVYLCQDESHCGDLSASFEKIDAKSYLWENLDFFVYCRFVKVN